MKKNFLIELAKKQGPQVWIGTRPPFDMKVLDLLGSTNRRVSPKFHQCFKVVWLYEHMISDLKENGWKIVLDESLRLIGQKGYVVVRSRESDRVTVVEIKHFFGRRFGLQAEVAFECHDEKQNIWTVCFALERKHIEYYNDHTWTFAMLTSGKKEKNVIRFLESIRNSSQGNEHEIIISGPQNSKYDRYHVKYLNQTDFRDEEYAEISKKKNAIVEMATNANLLIAHDRFVLNDNFFRGFEQYGYDFDFLTIKQFYESGKEYPTYCCLEKPGLKWSMPYQVDNYNQLYSSQYLNGGLLIFKTHMIRALKFNHLLMWNQMEDVELSMHLMNWGIIPRFNYFSSAKTIGVDEHYTETFKVDKGGLELVADPFGIPLYPVRQVTAYTKLASHLPENIKRTNVYNRLKQYLLHN
jgi:hypothetical protein